MVRGRLGRTAALVALGLAAAGLTAITGAARAAAVAPGPALTWGANFYGNLGEGTTTHRSNPVAVCAIGASAPCAAELTNAKSVSAGERHTLWLLADGTVAAAGYNTNGTLGDGTQTNRTTPVRVCAVGAVAPCASFLSGVTAVAAGNRFSLALLSTGSVVSWGENSGGYLGDGTTTSRLVPGPVCAVNGVAPCVAPLTGVTAIAAGSTHALAAAGGGVLAWGSNYRGRLGDGTTTDRPSPTRVCAVGAAAPCTSFLSGVTAIDAGNHSVAVAGGVAHAWGNGLTGELGDGANADSATPVRVCAPGTTVPCGSFLSGVTAISAAADGASFAVVNGVAHSWGSNFRGLLGDGTATNRATPVRVCAVGATAPCASFLSGVTAIDGDSHGLALIGGDAVAWGSNTRGQLGDGTTTNRTIPVRVCGVGTTGPCTSYLTGVAAIDAGNTSSAAVIAGPPSADLGVTLTATAPLLGTTINYATTITNNGPDATTSGTVVLTLPAATTNAASATCAYNPATKSAACPIGALQPGASATYTVRASFGVLTTGPLTATATRTTSTPTDPAPGNDTATAACTAITSLVIVC
ncbi:DUF11 domain-containing protein [Actinokineospora cianjurensis]|uniref:Alpha-tubulin suppressor-like RCC1 family protein n=1 Tax=Actinokineospora cianjurensis TaxID=585224 RepID=A0A421B2E9_9PSEU|nr:DUF11 domain-containing protein [Actinokineospora cianjurensis]RLK58557.1 alpha-tubulin suppressor-like RCC1 family protein [Actinokineospora cianjurensis]